MRRLALRSIGRVGPPFLRLMARTWKTEVEGEEHFASVRSSDGYLLALWHGRMVLGIVAHQGHDLSILVSHSKDGELMHRLLGRFGFGTVRGSTSRGAPRALREMLRDLKQGRGVVVTPDGPRGPLHRMNAGLAWMSRATGYPVVPIGFATNSGWVLPSWDRFVIPKPFARIGIVYGEPMWCDRRADDAEMETFTDAVRTALLEREVDAGRVAGGDVAAGRAEATDGAAVPLGTTDADSAAVATTEDDRRGARE
ncbi:lysophospholipid acyltransferase family protein [Rohdeia mirabilis]|uniref:lysophospholipid acyltransferase family protein n=1 Tax=Rohdeia mirabilis TaxID=2528008 RepID=UPI003AF39830